MGTIVSTIQIQKNFSTSLQRYKKIGISYDGVRGIGYLYAHYNPKV